MRLDAMLNACGFQQVDAPGYDYVPPDKDPMLCGCGVRLEVVTELKIPASHERRYSYLHVTVRHPRPLCEHFIRRLGMMAR